MRKATAILLILLLIIAVPVRVEAKIKKVKGDPEKEPVQIRCTFYCDHGITASGEYTRHGTLAGKREWLGRVVRLNKINEDGTVGDFLGFYQFTDTGLGIDTDGDKVGDSIKRGQSIDVWMESLNEAKAYRKLFGGDYVYMEFVD